MTVIFLPSLSPLYSLLYIMEKVFVVFSFFSQEEGDVLFSK